MPPTTPLPLLLAAAARRLPTTAPLAVRALSTTPHPLYRQPRVPASTLPIPSASGREPAIPPYPLGPRQTYHQSNTGLYGSARIRFGNRVSERNEIKTRRAWRPNVHHKRLWSASLGVYVRTRVTTRVLRTIDKVGGLDEYLLGIKAARVKELGPWGWRLRWRVMQTPSVRARHAAERVRLRLPAREGVDYAAVPEGMEAEGLMEETEGMLAREEEFVIGEEGKVGFMAEEQPEGTSMKK
ncbi:hypothetical protein B0T18DRAFT_431434 [Schizothecium vesticola]|uniref:Large ribosomal subunit protein bL28m n=1 Tax=Schizothecium vesticola TaxID=314040 RepID=A0AA40EH72_9PEZI|nr:hypothetical protein B0T18DRAFT_431434 [Schizothecium vesticola]